jgi:hypothetical protein
MVRSFILAAAASLALAACATSDNTASAEAPANRDCFNASSVSGYEPLDDNTVKLTVGANRYYGLTTQQRITETRFSEHIALRSTNNWICTGNGLGVSLFVPGGVPESYIVTQIARLPDQAAAPQGS